MKGVVTTHKNNKSGSKLPLWLAIVIVIGVAAFCLMKLNGNSTIEGKQPVVVETPSPTSHIAIATDNASGDTNTATPPPSANETQVTVKPMEDRAEETPLTPEEQKRKEWQAREDERNRKTQEILDKQYPRYFDNNTENTIEQISKPGAQFLMTPRIDLPQEEVIALLKKPVEIYDDDTPEAVEAKERTAKTKQEILKYIEEGGTINQYFRDVLADNNERKGIKDDVMAEKRRILMEEGEEAARAYLDSVNPQLKEMGLPEQKITKGDYKWMERQATRK